MKKFSNLSLNYKNLLNDIKNLLNNEIIIKIANNKIDYSEINNLFVEINNICYKNNCNIYDLNKLINFYDKENIIIQILKKLTNLRNRNIIMNSRENKLWEENLKNIQLKLKNLTNKTFEIKKIEDQFIVVLKKYKYYWDGYWHIFDIDNKGNIKNINLFDIEEIEEIKNNLLK
jgi:hypothetical protein